MRSKIRIEEGRAKPIDLLAKYINAEEDELAIEIEKKRTLLNENKKKNADMMVRKHDHKRNKKSTEF